MFTPLPVVRDVRAKGTGASRMEPYWTDSSLARARLSPQGVKGTRITQIRTPRPRASVCE